MRSKLSFTIVLFFFGTVFALGQDLSLTQRDLLVTQGSDGGFHLFIRKKSGISSVMLTETTKDPRLQEDNYAYRSDTWNAINGNERRILDGKFLPPNDKVFSLIDSTPEYLPEMGEVFHIYIPYIIYYGYNWSRHGEVYVGNGTYFNVRAFEHAYGDYRGAFKDNSFVLTIDQKPLDGQPADLFMRDTVDAFSEISSYTGGQQRFSVGGDDLIEAIARVLSSKRSSDIDIVFVIDTTASMQNEITVIREQLVGLIQNTMNKFRNIRIGFVFYKDYSDEYITRYFSFSDNFLVIQRTLNSVRARGGRDIPEAVYEGLYDAVTKFTWQAPSREIILIGDAPPHPRMRGKISKEMVFNAAAQRNITIDTIVLPQ
ncbi:MAG: VWA domain-containing protein [Termitinemataceae bacterium]|nr:MAG: VWA domain-containing protein [Termitinemataceae bacterium]